MYDITKLIGKKIFIGPGEVAGYNRGLAHGMKKIGINFDYITFSNHNFNYGGETKSPWLLKPIRFFYSNKSCNNYFFLKALRVFFCDILAFFWFIFNFYKYDIYIFCFGQSLLRKNIDLPILKFFGKTLIMNMGHGSELRAPYINGAFCPTGAPQKLTPEILSNQTFKLKKRMMWIEKHVDIIIGKPFSSTQLASKKMINWYDIGIPYFRENTDTEHHLTKNTVTSNHVRILHAPSRPAAKGSYLISKAIENLKKKGYSIQFVELRNTPNEVVLHELSQCDFVVDQVFSDVPIGCIGLEAAMFGKPTVVGGYSLDYLKKFVKKECYPPSKTCHPEDIEKSIEELIVDVKLRKSLGERAKSFVLDRWSSDKVAENYIRLISNDYPENWWFNPDDVIYIYGCSQSKEQTKDKVSDLVSNYSPNALQLSNPKLKKAFLDFIGHS
jgi:glycosyltransferase involved in cell wall biosynthesis